MNTNRPLSGTEQGWKVLNAIWLIMLLLSGLCYLGANVIKMPPSPGLEKFLFPVLAIVTGAEMFFQVLVRKNISDEKLFSRILDLDSWALSEEQKASLKTLQVPERGEALILQAHIVFNIVTWAIGSSFALYGLLLAILTGDKRYAAGFVVVTVLNMLYFRPVRSKFDEQVVRWRRFALEGRG
jgi:hypothetical protein